MHRTNPILDTFSDLYSVLPERSEDRDLWGFAGGRSSALRGSGVSTQAGSHSPLADRGIDSIGRLQYKKAQNCVLCLFT